MGTAPTHRDQVTGPFMDAVNISNMKGMCKGVVPNYLDEVKVTFMDVINIARNSVVEDPRPEAAAAELGGEEAVMIKGHMVRFTATRIARTTCPACSHATASPMD